MSAKTKIVVLRTKELIYTGLFTAAGILLIVLLAVLFLPKKEQSESPLRDRPPESSEPASESEADPSPYDRAVTTSAQSYTPGIYTTQLVLGGQTIDVEVIVGQDSISSIRLVNVSDSVTTMYPLLEPALQSICEQIYENQSLENVSYTSDSKYTSLVLLEAIRNSLNKARTLAE